MNKIWQQYPSIQTDLEASCVLIEKKVKIRNKEIESAIKALLHSGGKLLRPAYFLLFAHLGQNQSTRTKAETQQLIATAASLEILHMATLIHDDVIDNAPTRRGIPTIQAAYGKDIAVYTGDFLFTLYFELIAETNDTKHFIKLNAKAMRRLLLGELDQMNTRYNQNISMRDYLRSINGKTAELFALSCFEGAHYSQSSIAVQSRSARIGQHIGIAFQMLDDILDYTQTSDTIKKPVLADIQQGVYSLPLILAMQQDYAAFKPFLDQRENISETEIQLVLELIKKNKGIEQAQEVAKRYTHKALTGIAKLPDTPERQQLLMLTETLLHRKF